MPKWDNAKTGELMEAVLSLQDEEEAKRFFRDLMTERELLEFGNRWQAARMLYDKIPYTEIAKRTGLSSRTIARISKWLNNGKGGYLLLIQRNNSHHKNPSVRKGLR